MLSSLCSCSSSAVSSIPDQSCAVEARLACAPVLSFPDGRSKFSLLMIIEFVFLILDDLERIILLDCFGLVCF